MDRVWVEPATSRLRVRYSTTTPLHPVVRSPSLIHWTISADLSHSLKRDYYHYLHVNMLQEHYYKRILYLSSHVVTLRTTCTTACWCFVYSVVRSPVSFDKKICRSRSGRYLFSISKFTLPPCCILWSWALSEIDFLNLPQTPKELRNQRFDFSIFNLQTIYHLTRRFGEDRLGGLGDIANKEKTT